MDQLPGFGGVEILACAQGRVLVPVGSPHMEVIGAGFGDQVHIADAREFGGIIHGDHRHLLGVQNIV